MKSEWAILDYILKNKRIQRQYVEEIENECLWKWNKLNEWMVGNKEESDCRIDWYLIESLLFPSWCELNLKVTVEK
jgi:hypothetical protein